MRPQRRQPTKLPHPWDSPGKDTGVGCHFLLQCRKVKSERSRSVVSDSLQPHGLQPTRLLCPGKNTGVGCHLLLQCRKVKSERSRSVVSNSLQPHGLQPTRLLHPWDFPGKWGAIAFSTLFVYVLSIFLSFLLLIKNNYIYININI